jgi:hypothetical protein
MKMKPSEARRLLERGVALYNAGEFFECHEVLEALWRADSSEYRGLYQGVIKAAVAWYHAGRGNFVGARKVLQSGLRQLRLYLNRETPLLLNPFVNELERGLSEIEHCQQTGTVFDASLIPRLRWNDHFRAIRDSERSS